MSKVKFEEMKGQSIQELQNHVDSWRSEYTKLKFDAHLQKKAEHPHKFKLLKKQIARAKTVIRQKQMEGV